MHEPDYLKYLDIFKYFKLPMVVGCLIWILIVAMLVIVIWLV